MDLTGTLCDTCFLRREASARMNLDCCLRIVCSAEPRVRASLLPTDMEDNVHARYSNRQGGSLP